MLYIPMNALLALMVVSALTILSLSETKGIDLHEAARPAEPAVR